jgi:pilus assembly protein Flp/PilA
MFRRLLGDSRGATAIEYGLIAALVAVAAITAMKGLGNQLGNTYRGTAAKISAAGA